MAEDVGPRWTTFQVDHDIGSGSHSVTLLTFVVIYGLFFTHSCSAFLSSCGWWGTDPRDFLMVFQIGSSSSIFSGDISGKSGTFFKRFSLEQFKRWCFTNINIEDF